MSIDLKLQQGTTPFKDYKDYLLKDLINLPAKTPCFSVRDVGGH